MGAGALDLGNLYGKLAIDYSDLDKAEIAARTFASNTQKQLDGINKAAGNLKSVGKTMTAAVTLPIVAIAGASFEAARQFSISFADVQKNIADLDSSNIKEFEKTVLSLGAKSLLGADGLAALASEGGKLGENAKGALEFAKAAEKMAVAFDFGKTKEAAAAAGDVIGSIRSQFGYTTDEVLKLGDAINYFADQTSASAKGIISIINKQGSVVKGVTSLTDAELTALAATFESISPSVEIAATSMKNFTIALTNGAAATDEQKAVFKSLGLDAEKMAKLMSVDAKKGITTVLKSLQGLEKYKKSAIISTLFGKESIGSIMPMIENMELLEENFRKAGDSAKFLDSLTKEWTRAMNTDDNKMALALNALNVAMIQIGKVIVPIVADIATSFSNWLNAIGPIDPGLIKIGLAVAAVAAAVGPLLIAAGSFLGLLAPLISGAGGLAAVLATIGAVTLPAIAAFAAIAAAGYLIYQNWDELKAYISSFVDSVKIIFEEFNNALKSGDWSFFKQLAYDALKEVSRLVVSFMITVDEQIKKLPAYFITVFTNIAAYIKGIDWTQLGTDIMIGLKNGIIIGAVQVASAVKTAMDAVTEGAKEAVDSHSPSLVFAQIGKDIMLGLGLGITNNTNTAVAAMIKAGDTLNAAAKEKLTQQSFGSFESKLMLDTSMGEGSTNYELELQKEQAYYDQSKAMLDQAQALKLRSITSYAAMREAIEQKHVTAVVDIQRQMLQSTVQSLDASLASLESFGQKQSAIYKGIFAVSKAFAIAEALLAMQQNIAKASAVGFPYNIPFIAGAIAQGTSIIANTTAIAGAFNNGGHIPSGQVGLVGEKRGELVSGPANVLSAQNTHELFNGKGGSGTNVNIKVMNFGNSKVEVSESGNDQEKFIEIVVDRAKKSIAADAIRGDGIVDKTFSSVFKLPRTGTGG